MNLLLRLLFPPKCSACNVLLPPDTPTEEALCADCKKRWENERSQTCGVCALPVGACTCMTAGMKQAKCGGFLKLCYYLPRAREPVQNQMIYRIKESRDAATVAFLTRALAERLEDYLQKEGILHKDVILTYVPRSVRARLLHGTDQAKLLASALSKQTGLEMRTLLRRRKGSGVNAKQQKSLNAAQRYKNVKNAFEVLPEATEGLLQKRIFLIDDVVTTGASTSVCIKLLRKTRAGEICVLAVASDSYNRDNGVY